MKFLSVSLFTPALEILSPRSASDTVYIRLEHTFAVGVRKCMSWGAQRFQRVYTLSEWL